MNFSLRRPSNGVIFIARVVRVCCGAVFLILAVYALQCRGNTISLTDLWPWFLWHTLWTLIFLATYSYGYFFDSARPRNLSDRDETSKFIDRNIANWVASTSRIYFTPFFEPIDFGVADSLRADTCGQDCENLVDREIKCTVQDEDKKCITGVPLVETDKKMFAPLTHEWRVKCYKAELAQYLAYPQRPLSLCQENLFSWKSNVFFVFATKFRYLAVTFTLYVTLIHRANSPEEALFVKIAAWTLSVIGGGAELFSAHHALELGWRLRLGLLGRDIRKTELRSPTNAQGMDTDEGMEWWIWNLIPIVSDVVYERANNGYIADQFDSRRILKMELVRQGYDNMLHRRDARRMNLIK